MNGYTESEAKIHARWERKVREAMEWDAEMEKMAEIVQVNAPHFADFLHTVDRCMTDPVSMLHQSRNIDRAELEAQHADWLDEQATRESVRP